MKLICLAAVTLTPRVKAQENIIVGLVFEEMQVHKYLHRCNNRKTRLGKYIQIIFWSVWGPVIAPPVLWLHDYSGSGQITSGSCIRPISEGYKYKTISLANFIHAFVSLLHVSLRW